MPLEAQRTFLRLSDWSYFRGKFVLKYLDTLMVSTGKSENVTELYGSVKADTFGSFL